jgi:hypothetical protein
MAPNAIVEPIHPKEMPVILTTACSRVSLAEGGDAVTGHPPPARSVCCVYQRVRYDDGEPGDAENENRGHQAGASVSPRSSSEAAMMTLPAGPVAAPSGHTSPVVIRAV